jgi:hypothetical protein
MESNLFCSAIRGQQGGQSSIDGGREEASDSYDRLRLRKDELKTIRREL